MRVVIAIDFGTSRSGYAFGFFSEDTSKLPEIYVRTDWPGQPMAYAKTLTQLLYAPEGHLIAWGHEAPNRLAQLKHDPRRREYRLLRNFKMQIKNGQRTPKGPTFTDNNQTYAVLNLVVDYLKEVKKVVMNHMPSTVTGALKESEMLWCLTVPAIWSDADKQLMREAARQAGLLGGGFLLVLEPEAAAVYCMKRDQSLAASDLGQGKRFMIVDAGGGTVDLTVHEVADKGKLTEVARGSGGACGSTYVDHQFLNWVRNKVSPGVFTDFCEQDPPGLLDLLRDWELVKCNATGEEQQLIRIPRSLGRLLEKREYAILQKLAGEQQGDFDNFHLSAQALKDIFAPVLDDVVKAVHNQFAELGQERCDYIFVVGGFAASPILRQRLQTEFNSRVGKIVFPPEPGKAVVVGAAMFGLDPSTFVARRSRLTYGINSRSKFIPGVDPESKRVRDTHRDRDACQDVFSVFVKARALIKVEEKVTHRYTPTKADQKKVTFTIYCTEQTEVRHVDECHVRSLGTLSVQMPDVTGGLSRVIEVHMYFGLGEIRVEAFDTTSGNTTTTTIEFDYER